ncbi:MAG: CBS domain-containing protein [Myxococcales bacterium]|nr:CBS domain-containing protein [Myxococcales bacterium]MCB9575465.1 CBS domain-containing protein [Polyangiaceae bacterium]
MQIKDVMTRELLTVGADWTLDELKGFLLEHGISGAPVVDNGGKLIGVVSSTDLLRSDDAETDNTRADGFFVSTLDRPLAADELASMHLQAQSSRSVRDVMTPVMFQIAEDSSLDEVADMMARGRIHRVLVTNGTKVTGIVSALDLVRVLRDMVREQKKSNGS